MTAAARPWVIDLDGVVRNGSSVVPGAGAAVAALQRSGHPVAFCTNSAASTPDVVLDELVGHGVVADGASAVVLTSAMAVARLVSPGERVLCVADDGVREAVRRRGATVVEVGGDLGASVDAVVMGFHRSFDYDAMRIATRAVLHGARFLASNDDALFPDGDGPAPGCGALVASVERATGAAAEVAGKPYAPMADLVLEHLGHLGPGVVVGDSPGTDGGLAARLGWAFGLVLTGNTRPEDPAALDHDPSWVAPDLATLVTRHG